MKYTPNYNLKKPELTDTVKIDDLNSNMDIIDTQLKTLEDKGTEELTELTIGNFKLVYNDIEDSLDIEVI